MNNYEKKLLAINNLWAFGAGMLGPLFAVFAEGIGGNILSISWAWALYLIVTGFGIKVFGKISDRSSKRMMILAGLFITTLSTFGYLLVNSSMDLLILQIFLGLGLSLFLPSWNALYDKYSGDGINDGYIWGAAKGDWYLFSGVALVVGGLVVTYFSFFFLFLFMGLVHLLGFFHAMYFLKNE